MVGAAQERSTTLSRGIWKHKCHKGLEAQNKSDNKVKDSQIYKHKNNSMLRCKLCKKAVWQQNWNDHVKEHHAEKHAEAMALVPQNNIENIQKALKKDQKVQKRSRSNADSDRKSKKQKIKTENDPEWTAAGAKKKKKKRKRSDQKPFGGAKKKQKNN